MGWTRAWVQICEIESAGDHDLRLDIGQLELAVLEIGDPRAERLAVTREFDGEIEQALLVGEQALPGPILAVASPVWEIGRVVNSKMMGRWHDSIIIGTSVRFRSACIASARTRRDITERGDQSTTAALASRRARSMLSSNASPDRSAASHQAEKRFDSNASAKRRAVSTSSRA